MGNPDDKRGSADIDLPIRDIGEGSPSPANAPETPAEGGPANRIGPGGDTANQDIDAIESGQPAGGPYDLGERAAEADRD